MSSKRKRKILERYDHWVDEFARLSKIAVRDGSRVDPECVHDLRVTTRRLRAALWVFHHGAGIGAHSKLRSRLRSWTRALGRVREADMLAREARKFAVELASPDRQHPARHLIECIGPRQRRQMIRRLRRVTEELGTARSLHPRRAAALAVRKYFPVLQDWPTGADELHRLRIQVKKLRYRLEVVGLEAKPLKTIQDALGHFHDLQVLKEKSSEDATKGIEPRNFN